MSQHKDRPIDARFRPRVAGIDLEQSLNYLIISSTNGVDAAFLPGE